MQKVKLDLGDFELNDFINGNVGNIVAQMELLGFIKWLQNQEDIETVLIELSGTIRKKLENTKRGELWISKFY